MKWISVKDSLPDLNQQILYINYDGYIEAGEFEDEFSENPVFRTWVGYDSPIEDVTHWMPLPDKPEQTS